MIILYHATDIWSVRGLENEQVEFQLMIFAKSLLGLLSLLPLPIARAIGKGVGWMNFKLRTGICLTTEANIRLCLPELTESQQSGLVLASLKNTAQTMMEIPGVWLGKLERTNSWIIRVENEYLLDDALRADRGVVVLLPHQGNWEMYNVYTAAKNKHMTALYKPPDNDALKPLMLEIREKYGNELVPTNTRGIATLYRRLKSGGQVTILPDQVPRTGKFAPFFGSAALTDILISRMLKKTQAAIVCCDVIRRDRGFIVRFSEVDEQIYSSDLDESLVALNKTIERVARTTLEQYQWSYKRFRVRPSGCKKIYKNGGGEDQYHS